MTRFLRLFVPLCMLLLSGCAGAIGDNEVTWVWGAGPLVGFGLVGVFWIYISRKGQLERWDLRTSPVPPDAKGAAVALTLFAGFVALVFLVLNFIAEGVELKQQLLNAVLWCTASVIAVALAVMIGRRLAEGGYTRREK